MNTRHFETIAKILKSEEFEMPAHSHISLVDKFTDLFAACNPRFDEQKFRDACHN